MFLKLIFLITFLNLTKYVAACPIYLTLSLDGKTAQGAYLEINWGPECHNAPEWIGIFKEDPSISNVHPEFRFTNVQNASGNCLTTVQISKLRFPQGWNKEDINIEPPQYPKGKCLPFYAASFNGNELLTVECLKIQPNWMTKSKYISQMPLKELFLPGTHASGTFISPQVSVTSVFIKDYAVAQHFDIWSQLVFGIRYLEFSIGYKVNNENDSNDPKNFWIVNENMFVTPLRPLLKDIKRFAKISNEIIILDFSLFPIGFFKYPERHSILVHMLNEEIGDISFGLTQSSKPCDQSTVDDIRKLNKNILILYPIAELRIPSRAPKILCPNWKRFSTALMNTSQALDYMRLLFSKKPTSPVQDEGWVFEAVKSFEQSLNNKKLQTAKERANLINPKIANWLRGPWGQTANVVAMDYFSNTNIIDIAIYANMRKAFTAANKNFIQFEIITN